RAPVVQELAGQGLACGVHTVISAPRWTELKSRVRDYLGTKVEFRLGDVNETQIDRITREIPADRPGRAISMEKHHLMMGVPRLDRKSTRLNSSHVKISYAVFCLKKKKKKTNC